MCIEDEPKTIQALSLAGHRRRARESRSGTVGDESPRTRSAAFPLVRGLRGALPPYARPLSDAVGGLRTVGGFLHHHHRQAQILRIQFIQEGVE